MLALDVECSPTRDLILPSKESREKSEAESAGQDLPPPHSATVLSECDVA